MDNLQEGERVPVFNATPPDERKTIVPKKDLKITHPNQIPDEIIKDEFLNTLITTGLPRNYSFEVHKTIWKIKQTNSKRVLLQLPEGLIRFGTILVDIISSYFARDNCDGIRIITMGDLTYGACCIDDYLATSLGCDLIVHYAHSCLVPINQLSKGVKYLYIFLDIKFDLDHVISCVKHNFNPNEHKIALASTIQFVASVHEVARQLRDSSFKVTLPQSRPLSSGEVLGCTAPKLDPEINTIVFICDGRFHLEALMIANPTIDAYRYDPYSRKLTREKYAFNQMYTQRYQAISEAVRVMQEGGTFGFVLGTLGRQGNENVYDRMIDRLRKHTNCKYLKMLMPEVVQDTLKELDKVDVWVQVACPRLSIDWGSFFKAPLLNPYEYAESIKLFIKKDLDSSEKDTELSYPMDFYAKNSRYDHTPNHVCANNLNCSCSELKS